MKYLILLNRKFPYKSGESFLENEIEELSDSFEKIFIYPSDITLYDKQTRMLKSCNIEVRIFEKESLKKRKIKYLLNSPKFFFSKSHANTFMGKFYESYFLAAANMQAKKIISDLDKMSFSDNDEIYVYSYWLYINAKVACILKKYFEKRGIKVVAFSRAHRFDIYEENQKFRYLPQRDELFSELNHVYPCSDNGTVYLKEHYSVYADKISTSYLGTYDHGFVKPSFESEFHIVSCSRLSDVKRVHLIIDALSLLANSGLSLTWTHLGGGELYDELKNSAEQKLSWMNVNMVGQVSNLDVYDHYVNSPENLFINVSSSEGLPVSIMEAISFGIPVIATDVGGTSEIVINKQNGFILNKDFEPIELANLIKAVVTMDSNKYNELCYNARKIWEDKYQAPINYASFLKNFLSLKK